MTTTQADGVPFRFISLGGDCQPAAQIRRNRPNGTTHFFDWLSIPIRHTIRLIENDLDGGFEPENLHPLYLENRLLTVVDTRYHLDITHDFPVFDDETVAQVRARYAIRARWFRELLDDPDELPSYFVRRWDKRDGPENEADARVLYHLLKQRRRDIRFLYLHADPTRRPVRDGGYRSLFLRPAEPFIWYGDNGAWQKILNVSAFEPGPEDGVSFPMPPMRVPRFSGAAKAA